MMTGRDMTKTVLSHLKITCQDQNYRLLLSRNGICTHAASRPCLSLSLGICFCPVPTLLFGEEKKAKSEGKWQKMHFLTVNAGGVSLRYVGEPYMLTKTYLP